MSDPTRKNAADYLRGLATMIERGSVDAFHLTWQEGAARVEGNVVLDARAIQAPQPTIQFVDLSKKSDLPS